MATSTQLLLNSLTREVSFVLDLDLALDLDLNLGQWLARQDRYEVQCSKNEILVMRCRGHFKGHLGLDLDLDFGPDLFGANVNVRQMILW